MNYTMWPSNTDHHQKILWNAALVVAFVAWIVNHHYPHIIQQIIEIEVNVLIGIATIIVFFYAPLAVTVQNQKTDFSWDDRVILHHVSDLPSGMVYVFFTIVLPIALWTVLPIDAVGWRLGLLGSFIVGLCVFLGLMTKIYRWLYNNRAKQGDMDYRTSKRIEYLDSLRYEDKAHVWSPAVWRQINKQHPENIERLLDKFLEQVDELNDARGYIVRIFTDNVGCGVLRSKDAYQKIFLYLEKWEQEETKSDYHQLKFSSEFTSIAEVSLKTRDLIQPFFEAAKKYTKDLGELGNSGLSYMLYNALFCTMNEDNMSAYTIWVHFPDEWKINSSNLGSKDNHQAVKEVLLVYLHWRLTEIHRETDKPVDTYAHNQILHNVFNCIEPYTWNQMLLLLMYPVYRNKVKGESSIQTTVKNFIEDEHVNRLRSSIQPKKDITYQSGLEETIKIYKLATSIGFEHMRNTKHLNSLIKTAKQFTTSNPEQEIIRDSLIKLVTDIKKYL